MTPEERAEGRRLLKIAQLITKTEEADTYEPFDEWLREHAPELLADHAEISQAAVREFAEKLLSDFDLQRLDAKRNWQPFPGDYLDKLIANLRDVAADRGVKLDETP